MREHIQLIRVAHPYLGPYSADLTTVRTHTTHEYKLFVLLNNGHPPLEQGERLVLKWEGEGSKVGRGVVEEVRVEKEEGDGLEWQGIKLSLNIKENQSDHRHYPRLYAGFELYVAPLDEFEDIASWLEAPCNLEEVSQDKRFIKPSDELMNFSVNGIAFETPTTIEQGQQLLCVLHINSLKQTIKCLAKVVRCERTYELHSVALSFISPPQKLIEVLTDFTLKLQKKEIEGDSDEV